MAKKQKTPTSPPGTKLITDNRKARHDYAILDTYEAGLVLQGTEVKALRSGGTAQLGESYCIFQSGEMFLFNAFISQYSHGNQFNHEERRTRKLLMHMAEIDRLFDEKERSGLTIIPLKLYFKDGKVKVQLGVAKGKKNHDKRATIKERDWNRQQHRLLQSYKGK
ncbi:MAG: SsrA-binding protein SmpB [Pseudomonadota bacterium]|nr:SsrA-binding protein SmpB [Pseudomonadota bacterium]